MDISTPNIKKVDISNFTKDQAKAYESILEFINSPYDEKNFKIALTGAAGTGKTYLVKALLLNSKKSFSVVGLAAPTHKAVRVLGNSIGLKGININTLQSDLGLRLNFDVEKFDINNPPFDPKGKIKIGNYQIYIVDEASMINRGLCMFLEKTCKSNKTKLIYIGDESQLSPVGERYSSSFKGLPVFRLFEIVRQGEDNPISYLLNLLRYDVEHKTYNFLNYIVKNPSKFNSDYTKGYQVCNTEMFNQFVYNNFNDEELTRNVDYTKVIGYTNKCVTYWNKIIRSSIIEDANKSILGKNDLIISYVTLVNNFNECIIKNSEEYIINDIVNYIHHQYELKGFMVKFTAIHGGTVTKPLFIVDHSDRFTVQKYVQISKSLIEQAKAAKKTYRSQSWKNYYEFKENCLLLTNIINQNRVIEFSRDIDYGFALTSHKSQGSTFDTVLVDVNDIVYDKNGNIYTDCEDVNRRLYVACSRARNKLYLKFGK